MGLVASSRLNPRRRTLLRTNSLVQRTVEHTGLPTRRDLDRTRPGDPTALKVVTRRCVLGMKTTDVRY